MTFTQEQIAYLESLPAVARASATRIRYADDFRRACLERYRHGESPTALFREAGLDPKLVGYKRIERCFARWKRQELELSGGIDGGDAMTGDQAASATSRGMTPPPLQFSFGRTLSQRTISTLITATALLTRAFRRRTSGSPANRTRNRASRTNRMNRTRNRTK
ncbi:hypothetical protein [Bifidobacterium sp. UTCIF-38]|uniref:hypothetical protein n=1 Tax=Bifidobacterium sp. UTCIF-38 TaxID=1465260 RepID=UPI00112CCB24|nr:hypothetical protein [Bifidobacterium sp. UTCIF-38]TPF88210.1 hypothetical protein BW11_08220 [Bifidobacterium sp. UTCIF-38]